MIKNLFPKWENKNYFILFIFKNKNILINGIL